MRRITVAAIALLASSVLWYGMRGTVAYRVACSSIGCPGRESLIAAALRRNDPRIPAHPQHWNYDLAQPEWIAWSSFRAYMSLEDGSTLRQWQVVVADHDLVVRGVITGDRLPLPPADSDGDGLCEVVKEIGTLRYDAQQNIVWWAVLRLGDERNEIVWVGLIDESVWRSRQTRLRPIWLDTDGDGVDELVFITVEIAQTPDGRVVFKPPQTVAVFEWTAPGGILRTRLLPDDCGILPWSPEGSVPMRVDQATDLDLLVRELLPAAKVP